MTKKEYFEECIADSAQSHGIPLTIEQIGLLAEDVSSGYENMSLAYPIPENPMIQEVKDLKRMLDHEKSLVHCKVCDGSGRIHENFGPRSSNTECSECRGKGKKAI